MERLFNWIKDHKCKSLLIVIAFFFVPLIIVHLLFKLNSGIYMFQAEWSAGELIAYIAGFEAFIGTVSLGALVLWQNIKFKESTDNNDKLLMQIENEKIRLGYLPQFVIQTANPEKCVDYRYKLSPELEDKYIPLNRFKTYGFFIRTDRCEWIPTDRHPIIEIGTESRIFSIANCGNNTAHQVKLSILVGNECYQCEKATSVIKDEDIFFYFGFNPKVVFEEKLYLVIRFFDCFQNVYEQKFEIINKADCLYFISYDDVNLIKRNKSMDLLTMPKK